MHGGLVGHPSVKSIFPTGHESSGIQREGGEGGEGETDVSLHLSKPMDMLVNIGQVTEGSELSRSPTSRPLSCCRTLCRVPSNVLRCFFWLLCGASEREAGVGVVVRRWEGDARVTRKAKAQSRRLQKNDGSRRVVRHEHYTG